MSLVSETNIANSDILMLFHSDEGGTAIARLSSEKSSRPSTSLRITPINESGSRSRIDELFNESQLTGDQDQELIDYEEQLSKEEEAFDIANRDRLVFLSRKYAGNYSKEDDARLEILKEKIRTMLPRVTENDFQYLANIAQELSDIHNENQNLWKELGLEKI